MIASGREQLTSVSSKGHGTPGSKGMSSKAPTTPNPGSLSTSPTRSFSPPYSTQSRRSVSPFDMTGRALAQRRLSTSTQSQVTALIWLFDFLFDDTNGILFPKRLLFKDCIYNVPLDVLDISGWTVNFDIFDSMRLYNKAQLKILNLNHVTGLCPDHLELIRGAPKLRTITIHGALLIDNQVAKFFGSLASLLELDLSDCKIEKESMEIMSLSCTRLRKLVCSNNVGLNDESIQHVGLWVARHRNLQNISFLKCSEFTDEGILDFLGSVQPLIKTLSFEGCRALTSLALVALRKPMRVLESLNLSSMLLGQSPYEWVSEGCSKLKVLNVSKSLEFDDESLIKIAKSCKFLENLNISKCGKITDTGVVGFMKHFEGSLVVFDLSLCIMCTTKSVLAISDHVATLNEIKISGLSQVNAAALSTLLKKASRLVLFEMVVELRVTATHRRSLLSHVNDEALCAISTTRMRDLRLTGACLITNVGAMALATRCKQLHTLDISACTQISDNALIELGKYSKALTYLNVSGCDIHDNGIEAIAAGCFSLKELHMNGCTKITNCGMSTVACLLKLETLCARNCEYLSNPPFILIARSCKKLKHVDLDGLDLVTVAVFHEFAKSCVNLRRLSGEHCSMSSSEFGVGSRCKLPLALPIRRACKLEDRSPPLVNYNRLVLLNRRMDAAALVIQSYVRHRVQVRLNTAKENLRKAIELERARLAAKPVRVRTKIVVIKTDEASPEQTYAAKVLQCWCKRINGVKFAKRKVADVRRRKRAATIIQKIFRGMMCHQLLSSLLLLLLLISEYLNSL